MAMPSDLADLAAASVGMEGIATAFFAAAVVHTFLVPRFMAFARRFRSGSVGENLFHLLGEVEVVFGVWATLLMVVWSLRFGTASVVGYLESVNFTEPAFVFVIMAIAATRPVIHLTERCLSLVARSLPLPGRLSRYVTILTVGPVLGSFITEPAAMTIAALLLRETVLRENTSVRLKYVTLAILFVNISIGGSFTHYAAPPVVMVARSWGWDLGFLVWNFGWRALIAILLNVGVAAYLFRGELSVGELEPTTEAKAPLWTSAVHVMFIALTVIYAHHMSFFIPLFLLFLGWAAVTNEHQEELRLRQALLVGYFLGGLVTLGGLQAWWLRPLLEGLPSTSLFWGAAGLTAITDNAALTYLGTLVPTLSDDSKYALVAGALAGGGLTVIANAPNPAGYSILTPLFGPDGISPVRLFLAALPFTLLAALSFILL